MSDIQGILEFSTVRAVLDERDRIDRNSDNGPRGSDQPLTPDPPVDRERKI